MLVTFVSMNLSQNLVYYSSNRDDLDDGQATVAIGSSTSYSQLLDINSYLYKPQMGIPNLNDTLYLVNLQNTSSWAYTVVDGVKEKWSNYEYMASNTPLTGLQAYNNPYMYYDSPHIHQATLSGLKPGVTYYYRPSDSCRDYEFTMPLVSDGSDDVYPFTVGMVCDLGQTTVSNASINALLAINPSVVLLSGDLAYADGRALT